MEDDFNNLKFENSEENSINKSPIKQTKLVSTRKRKELINADSDNEENITNKNIPLQIINKEESKGDENNDYKNERLASKYGGNKFNTIERNNVGGSPLKNNSTLQEKLKKIFLNRDKLKFQYSKQEIPDNLKYNSDDSESSDISGLRKSRKSRKSDKNSDLNNNMYEKRENKKNSINSNNISEDLRQSDIDGGSTFSPPLPAAFNSKEKTYNINISKKKEENLNYNNSIKKVKNGEKRKFSSYIEEEEEKTKSNEKSGNKYDKGNFKYANNRWNIKEKEKEKIDEDEPNNSNKKEKAKKNILLKVLEKRDKKDEINEENDNKKESDYKYKYTNKKEIREEEDISKKEKQQKLLKLLLQKKNSNNIEKDNDFDDEDIISEETSKNKVDIEKEKRRRKIIEELQAETNSSPSVKRIKNSNYTGTNKKEKEKNKFEIKENNEKNNKKDIIKNKEKEEKEKKEEKMENEEIEEYVEKDKGTYLPNAHKNKLTINIKPQNNQISSPIKEKNNINKYYDDENNEEEEDKNTKNKKANALLGILEKLKKKKSEEQNTSKEKNIEKINNRDNDIIDESEIEREAEKIRKKEKKMEERRLARERQKKIMKNEEIEEESNLQNRNIYGCKKKIYSINNNKDEDIKTNIPSKKDKDIKTNIQDNKDKDIINTPMSSKNEKENKREEIKRRKQFEEDLKAEINDYNKEEESTVINSSKSNVNLKSQINENEEKKTRKEFSLNSIQTRNSSKRYKNVKDEGAAPNEIIINDLPTNSLDRSFDTYMKRRIPSGKNSLNIYKPRRVDIRGRSQEKNINELIQNNCNSFNPSQNINFNNVVNPVNSFNQNQNKLTYIKKKSSFNGINNFFMNNHSFCEYPKENITQNINKEGNDMNNINMEIDLGAGLNSSFDNNIYMRNKIDQQFYGTTTNKFGNGGYSRATHGAVNNINYNKNFHGNFYKKGVDNDNENNANRSYGYINTNKFNNINKTSIYNNNNNNLSGNNRYDNNEFNSKINIRNDNDNNNSYYGNKKQQFVTYNNINQTSINCNSPMKSYNNNSFLNIQTENSNNNFYQNPPTSARKYPKTNKNKIRSNNLSNLNNNINYINNCTPYPQEPERNTSINIEDLMVLDEKLKEIIIALNRNGTMHNECFEFWNYYYNCSFYGKLEKLFKNENDSNNVQICIYHILISVMICYDFSFEIEILNNETSILVDILSLNHRNLILIYEHILSKISSESKSNPWVYKLNQLVNNFNKIDKSDYISTNGRKLTLIEKIIYNVSVIVQNIRVLLKNYKTKRIEYLTSIFKKINEKTYEEINSYFRDNILRVDNVKGSVLASVFLKENEYFQTEPAPYIKTKNRKPFSLILDLDETLVHFKINSEDDTEGTLQIRPGIMQFLELVSKYYELIVFTAATQDYGDLLIDAIEENNVFFEHRFYRQHTVIIGNDFVKDLNRIGRPLDKIIIVDNMPQNFRLQKENGINIKAFWGEDVNDNALEELGKILVNIAKDGGDVRIGLEKYRDEIVKKVTSNISKCNY